MGIKHISTSILMAILAVTVVACEDSSQEHIDMEEENQEHAENTNGDEASGNKGAEGTSGKAEQASATISFPEPQLQKKDEGNAVQDLQEALRQLSYEVEPDGIFQDRTTWAITDIQMQLSLPATGMYDEETKKTIKEALEGDKVIEPEAGLPWKEKTQKTEDGSTILSNPHDVLALVNKHNALPSDYIPNDLTIPDVRFPFTEDLPKRQLREIAADALEDLFAAGDEAGMDLFAQSGYRSYERQDELFTAYAESNGMEAANNFSARPGESEHQTGLTMDVTAPSVDHELTTDFGDTEEGKWVKEHASTFGFIIRYPEDKEDVTEYQYEPWHLRYVGKKAAEEIMSEGITLEEYLGE